jgi:hypothetical protein
MTNDFIDASGIGDDLADELHDRLPDAVESGMGETHDEAVREVRRNDSDVGGSNPPRVPLVTALHVAEKPTDAMATVALQAPERYANLEFGTGIYHTGAPNGPYATPDPHPPFEHILAWVVEKGITPDPSGPYDTQIGLAEAITFAIGDLGNKPHPFMRPAWRSPNGWRAIVDEASDAMSRAVRAALLRL